MIDEAATVVLHVEGEGLLFAELSHFMRPPGRDATGYFLNGRLYQISAVIETVGGSSSPSSGVLHDLLTRRVGRAAAEALIAGSRPIGGLSTQLVRLRGSGERLIYVHLLPQVPKLPKQSGELL